ncbi:MAG: type II toxin-antitoxin system RelE/ParE family toxin [Deltaproteobacteria bacterium]|nr:type II toxin-antitoxin system RelE/ParE family toxin [Deltaproteobacteria bacterium]
MIRSFRCKDTERLYNREPAPKIPPDTQKAALRKLWVLDAATSLADLRSPPGNRLEALKGDRESQYSICINDRFRICFVWQGKDAFEVEIVDYH